MQAEIQRNKFRGLPFLPSWYHHHGLKMQVREFHIRKGYLVIANNTASVIINRNREITDYRVSWQIIHSMPDNEVATGFLTFSSNDLFIAFGLMNENGLEQKCEGKYFRFKNYLNIPYPGTGNNGDPNISIYLSNEIKEAVRKFIT